MSDVVVLPMGPERARIMLVGECPGETEVREGRPFAGMAGRVLDTILEEVGITLAECRVTNVMQTRPPGNNFSRFYERDGKRLVPSPELTQGYERLRMEIAACQPNVIVPMGNEAMKALVGFGGIMDWRGSILESPFGKVIPTYHPAAVAREWTFRPASVIDFGKVKTESMFPELRRTERTLLTSPTFEEIIHHLQRMKGSEHVSFDIETETEQITCIGFSDRRDWAICVPFWFGGSGSLWSPEQEAEIWKGIFNLLEDQNIKKIAHNGVYDIEYLDRTMGLRVRNYWLDTMIAFHACYLELPKGLDFLTSVYTDHPYYKYQRRTDDMKTHWKYNATDACITYEIAFKVLKDMEDMKVEGFYRDYMHSLIEPLYQMQKRGVRFDVERCKEVRKQYKEEIEMLEKRLVEEVGHELNCNSHKQMTTWLYTELNLPKKTKLRKSTGEQTLAADEEALNELYDKHKIPALRTILEIRERKKIYSTYLEVKLDEDKRIRCAYQITGTETGRLSSNQTARGTGTNLQNIPGGLVKSLFTADPGCVLINADLSQAEARVVAHLSGDERLIRVFDSGGDIHRKNAANIFNKKEEDITDDERQMAKRVVHASNYGMGPRTFAQQTGLPESEARRLLAQYFATYPRIKLWHMQIKAQLQKSKVLTTPLGRKRIFFNKWTDQQFKEGLAYIPQSTVADVVNQGLIELYKEGVELLLQVHDSVVAQCGEDVGVVGKTVELIKRCMTRPIEINGKILVIPVDVKVGKNWDKMDKYKR